MNVRININYRGTKYSSNAREISEEEYTELERFLELIAQGKSTYLSIEHGKNKIFFPQDILKESIITLETLDNG